jgi:glycogen(starch) synthase
MSLTASVIISTSNRAAFLRRCLQSLQRQTFSDFEVVVVEGPSSDDTSLVCTEHQGAIKHVHCQLLNLSLSRNKGISCSAGNICAFIDDDAVAHPRWLERMMSGYANTSVVGVGGYTYDKTGTHFQSQAVICDRAGEAHSLIGHGPAQLFGRTKSEYSHLFPSLLGTNCSFRRSALLEIDGFDEVFAYFLDETDVCLRLWDRGGDIVTIPDALVYHGYAPSHIRTCDNVPKTRYFAVRSKVYYCKKHLANTITPDETDEVIRSFIAVTKQYNKEYYQFKQVSLPRFQQLEAETDSGFKDGLEEYSVYQQKGQKSYLKTATRQTIAPFLPYPSLRPRTSVAFISRFFPPFNTQGISRWTSTLAAELQSLGIDVHVITQGTNAKQSYTMYSDGIWVHRISPNCIIPGLIESFPLDWIPPDLLRWSAAAYSHILKTRGLDPSIISAPIWDLEGIVPLVLSNVPTVTSLHTTYGLTLPFKKEWRRNPKYMHEHVNKVIQAESFTLQQSVHLLANSFAIVKDLESHHGINLNNKTHIVPHGLPPAMTRAQFQSSNANNNLTILFVGRQESRKGFDTAVLASLIVCSRHRTVDFIFIGKETADDECSACLRQLALSSFSGRVRVLGHVSDEDLDFYYRSCDLFICPSRYESFGLIAIEAMRHSKAVISSNRGGLAEIVIPGYTGLHVDPESPELLAVAILDLLNDPMKRNEFGRNGLAVFTERYTSKVMGIHIADFYNHIVGPVSLSQ